MQIIDFLKERKHTKMTQFNIKISQIDDVYKLVNILVGFDGDIDLESGRYIVDGKSILGIFSLNLREPVKVTIRNCNRENELKEALKQYIVE